MSAAAHNAVGDCVRIPATSHSTCEETIAKKRTTGGSSREDDQITPVVAATLAGVIYQARLMNRASKLNIPEHEVVADVVNLWHTVLDALGRG